MTRFTLLLAVSVAATMLFAASAEANHDIADIAACGGRVAHGPREARRALNRCVRQRRADRSRVERERVFALHRGPRAALVAGYDGALYFYGTLLFQDGPGGRYRTPSFLAALHVRGNFLNRMGAFVTIAPALGGGRIGGRDSMVGSTNVERTATGSLEAGFVLGPFRRVCITVGSQMRILMPRTRQISVYVRDIDATESVRWHGLLLGVGPRVAVNLMFGRERETYLEIGYGAGVMVGRGGGYMTLGARVGHFFGR